MFQVGSVIQDGLTLSITRAINTGGMSEIYEAHALGVNGFKKRVALKVLDAGLAEHPELLSNFVGEAKLTADLIHANIGQIYHLGVHEGRFYIAMEMIDGVSLRQFELQHVDLGRAVPVELAIFIVSRVARGLAYAHEKKDAAGRALGLVHRDVNPDNVLLSFEGDVKLVDFGVAKARSYMVDHEQRVIAGKLGYMSPEQISFQRTDFRSDVFSLGIVLCELLCGRALFAGEDVEESRRQILAFDVKKVFAEHAASFDERVRPILERSMRRSASERYGATRELLVDLERHLYAGGYGPTNDTLAAYLRELFPSRKAAATVEHGAKTVIVR
jgi:serine/threonine-protein kinase